MGEWGSEELDPWELGSIAHGFSFESPSPKQVMSTYGPG